MRKFIRLLIALSAIGFVMAVVMSLLAIPMLGVKPEGFSNASTNLALLAIALQVACGPRERKA